MYHWDRTGREVLICTGAGCVGCTEVTGVILGHPWHMVTACRVAGIEAACMKYGMVADTVGQQHLEILQLI